MGGHDCLMHEKEKVKELFYLTNLIANESSINGKIAIIEAHADNVLFKKLLRFVYDPFVTTGVSFKGLQVNIDDLGIVNSSAKFTIESLMDYVTDHNTGSFSTIGAIKLYAMAFDDKEIEDFLYKVFSKELKIGATAKSINKALGKGFIREFGVQLAHPYHKYADRVDGRQGFVLTQKLDGHRAACIVKDGKATFYTRKGLEVPGMEAQAEEASKLVSFGLGDGKNYVLDGELLLENDEGLESKDLFRKTSKVLRNQIADKSKITFNIFDGLPLDEFLEGESKDEFYLRKNNLMRAFGNAIIYRGYVYFDLAGNNLLNDRFGHLRLVQNLYNGNDVNEIYYLQKTRVKPNGWEGLMLNFNHAKYVTKRTPGLLKIKEFFDADVVVTDVFEGTGNLFGMLGGVVVDYKGYPVRVGSGFTQTEREQFWNDKDSILGKVIQINYFEETHNQNNDDISLRFPTFVCLRPDKTPDDVSYEV